MIKLLGYTGEIIDETGKTISNPERMTTTIGKMFAINVNKRPALYQLKSAASSNGSGGFDSHRYFLR
ncbi:MAG: hypothetical protein PHX08_08100 [Lachnospiraceae bacterium]|nr:hypothetical protein [Lachnospiraceae bacterium]